jgi:hypothetical protein
MDGVLVGGGLVLGCGCFGVGIEGALDVLLAALREGLHRVLSILGFLGLAGGFVIAVFPDVVSFVSWGVYASSAETLECPDAEVGAVLLVVGCRLGSDWGRLLSELGG